MVNVAEEPTRTVYGLLPTRQADLMAAAEPRYWQNHTAVGVLAGSGLEAKYNSLLASHGDSVRNAPEFSRVNKEFTYQFKGDPGENLTDTPTRNHYSDAFREVWQFVYSHGLALKGYVNIPVGYMFSKDGKPICVWVRCESGKPIIQIFKQVANQQMVEITSSKTELGRVRLFNELPDTPAGRWVDESFARAYAGQVVTNPPG